MRVLIAPDSFKECLSAHAVAAAIAEGWCDVHPDDDLDLVPIADGGEGTVDAILAAKCGTRITARVTGPLGIPVDAVYGLLDDGTAIIEMAAASGLALVPTTQRNPAITTTRGTGELLLHAVSSGATRIVLGIGGSATNDGGAGLLQALGYRLLDDKGSDLPPGGAALADLARIEPPPALHSPRSPSHATSTTPSPDPTARPTFMAPKKARLTSNCLNWILPSPISPTSRPRTSAMISAIPAAQVPQAASASPLLAFLSATLRPGIEIIAEITDLDARIANADLVITGEGRVDAQSLMGKAIGGLITLTQRHHKALCILAGGLGPGCEELPAQVIAIAPEGTPVGESIARAEYFLRETGMRIARETRRGCDVA